MIYYHHIIDRIYRFIDIQLFGSNLVQHGLIMVHAGHPCPVPPSVFFPSSAKQSLGAARKGNRPIPSTNRSKILKASPREIVLKQNQNETITQHLSLMISFASGFVACPQAMNLDLMGRGQLPVVNWNWMMMMMMLLSWVVCLGPMLDN